MGLRMLSASVGVSKNKVRVSVGDLAGGNMSYNSLGYVQRVDGSFIGGGGDLMSI